MENIVIEIGLDKIKAGFEKSAEELFKSSYSNPIQKLLEESIKSKEGQIKLLVDEIIAGVIGTPVFKEKMTEVIMSRMIESALRK